MHFLLSFEHVISIIVICAIILSGAVDILASLALRVHAQIKPLIDLFRTLPPKPPRQDKKPPTDPDR